MAISDGEHYEVWVTLERWSTYDDKAEDCQTTKIADIAKREDAEVIFEACEATAVGIAPVIINNFKLDAET